MKTEKQESKIKDYTEDNEKEGSKKKTSEMIIDQ